MVQHLSIYGQPWGQAPKTQVKDVGCNWYIAAPRDAGRTTDSHTRSSPCTQGTGQRKHERGSESPLHAAHNRTETRATHAARRLYNTDAICNYNYSLHYKYRYKYLSSVVTREGVCGMLPLRRTARSVSDGPIVRAHFTSYRCPLSPLLFLQALKDLLDRLRIGGTISCRFS